MFKQQVDSIVIGKGDLERFISTLSVFAAIDKKNVIGYYIRQCVTVKIIIYQI